MPTTSYGIWGADPVTDRSPPHLMQWKLRRQLQSDPDLDKECGSGADLAHAMQIFVAEAEEEMTFINTSFIFPIINNNNNKNPQLNHSVILQSFILFCFLRIQCVSDWSRIQIKTLLPGIIVLFIYNYSNEVIYILFIQRWYQKRLRGTYIYVAIY